MLANELKRRIEPYALIKADAAEPKSIAELNNLGINAIPAQKGPDSVLHGIKWLKGFEIIVDPKCNGVTNLLANVKNTTQSDKNMQEVIIILLDENGQEIYKMPGIIEEIKAGETIQFNSSITADFANAYDFKIVKE